MISIGLVDNGISYIACSSSFFTLDSAAYVDANTRCFPVKGCKHAIASFTGSTKTSVLLRYAVKLIDEKKLKDGKLTINYIVNNVLEKISKVYYENNIIEPDDNFSELDGDLLIAKDDQLFVITNEFVVSKIEDYKAMDVGERMDGLYLLKHYENEKDITYRLLKAMYEMIRFEADDFYPILIRNTEDPSKMLMFSLEETIQYIREYEKKENH